MDASKPVVAGVDGSESATNALRWAVREARRHHAPLRIVHGSSPVLDYGTGFTRVPADYEWEHERARKILADAEAVARAEAGDTALDISTERTDSAAIPSLLELSKNARMIVVGTRGLGVIRRGLLGSVSSAVAGHAHCPVAVIHETTTEATESGPVVVGVDGSRCSEAAVEFAFEEAACRGAVLVAVHAWADTSEYVAPGVDWPAMAPAERAVLAESLAGFQERYPDVDVERILVRDRPTWNLFEQSKNAQLLVVGSHGRGGFAGMLLGSTSQALLHSVQCPIVIVRMREPARSDHRFSAVPATTAESARPGP